MKNISINKLCKSYGDTVVLKDFSLSIEDGKCTVLMGPSGCGKTTLVSILLDIEKKTAGAIENMPDKVSAVFQENRLCEEFTAFENVTLALREKQEKNQERDRILTAFEKVGMKEYIDTPVYKLSGGQKRRIAILRALLYPADLYIFDEPFSGLDDECREQVMNFVKEITKDKTVIMITHDMTEAEFMTDKEHIEVMGK